MVNVGSVYSRKNFDPRLRKRDANPKSILDVLVFDSSDLLLLLQRNPDAKPKTTPGQIKIDDKDRNGNNFMDDKEDKHEDKLKKTQYLTTHHKVVDEILKMTIKCIKF